MMIVINNDIHSSDLMEIKGRHGDWLDRIEFITYLGKN
jgi:hypothetical protein